MKTLMTLVLLVCMAGTCHAQDAEYMIVIDHELDLMRIHVRESLDDRKLEKCVENIIGTTLVFSQDRYTLHAYKGYMFSWKEIKDRIKTECLDNIKILIINTTIPDPNIEISVEWDTKVYNSVGEFLNIDISALYSTHPIFTGRAMQIFSYKYGYHILACKPCSKEDLIAESCKVCHLSGIALPNFRIYN